MRTITLPNTDLSLSRICFGTASIHRVWSESARLRLLEAAIDVGISHIDSAPYYGDGISELTIGRLGRRARSAVSIATKFGLYPRNGCARTVPELLLRRTWGRVCGAGTAPIATFDLARATASLELSIQRLRVEAIDLLLLHEPWSTAVGLQHVLGWLERQRSLGKLRHWGVAGERHRLTSVVASHPELAQVVQTRHEGDQRLAPGDASSPIQPNIVYGCLRAGPRVQSHEDAAARIRQTLHHRPDCAVIISTTRLPNLQAVRLAMHG